jgi:hypothetical protein
VRGLAALLAVVALTACGGKSDTASVPPGAIAVVGGRAVTRGAFERELVRVRHVYALGGKTFPTRGTTAYRGVHDNLVRLLVDRARLEVEAEHEGITVTNAQVDARLRRLKQKTFGGDEARYRAQLRQTGMTDAGVREALRIALLGNALVGKHPKPPRVTYAPGFEPHGGA